MPAIRMKAQKYPAANKKKNAPSQHNYSKTNKNDTKTDESHWDTHTHTHPMTFNIYEQCPFISGTLFFFRTLLFVLFSTKNVNPPLREYRLLPPALTFTSLIQPKHIIFLSLFLHTYMQKSFCISIVCNKKQWKIAQTVATQPRQLHYSNNLSEKKIMLPEPSYTQNITLPLLGCLFPFFLYSYEACFKGEIVLPVRSPIIPQRG